MINRTETRILTDDTRSEGTGMTGEEIEVAIKKGQEAQERTETIEEIETVVIETIVEDAMIATSEIAHVQETEGTEF